MSWFTFLLHIYYLCYSIRIINSQSTTSSGCNYVAVDWDTLRENEETSPIIRQYIENVNATFYLPPFPKVWVLNGSQDIYNESFALIPYPINECFKTPNEQINVFPSYNFYCNSNGEPELRTYKDTLCDTLDKKFTFKNIFDSSDYSYDCSNGAESSCPYVSITETYYEEEECEINIENNNNKLQNTFSYIGKYAVDVCLTYDSETSYKYVCDTRTKTYTIITYSDGDCSSEIIEKDAGHNGFQCTSYSDASYDINSFSIKSEFNTCTSIDEFDEIYTDYCVSSQVSIVYIEDEKNEYKLSVVPQFGPFGIQHISEKQVTNINNTNITNINACDLCNITNNKCDVTDKSILVIDEEQTEYIINNCDGVIPFVNDIQNLQNISVYGIIFTSATNISNNNMNENNININIPTRIIHPSDISDIKNQKKLSLSCNYRKGYPEEICVSVSCENAIGYTNQCDNIIFAGTYIIQNMSGNNAFIYNNNPVWIKQEMGDVSKQYIWLNHILVNDKLAEIQPYTELQWIISSQPGNINNNSLYCNITDVNKDISDEEKNQLSNFDILNCEWKSIESINNPTNISNNVNTAPYKCFDMLFNVPIAFKCLKTYKLSNIKDFIGTYYEMATDSNVYVSDETLAVLKRGYKYENCCPNDKIFYTSSIQENESYKLGNGCNSNTCDTKSCDTCETFTNLNISWILYSESQDDDNIYYKIYAYCDDIFLSVTACNNWYIYNEEIGEYESDYSFDIDSGNYEECNAFDDSNINYSNEICLTLMSDEIIYSQVQYLWGSYKLLPINKYSFNNRPIYQNINLQNTRFNTYIIWYDPLDSWIFITKSQIDFNESNIILSHFDTFDKIFFEENTEIVVAYCFDNIENNNNIEPEKCETGWVINNIFYNVTDILLTENNCDIIPNNTINFTKENEIIDLCLAFYSRETECLLPDETSSNLLNKEKYCDTPEYFEIEICDESNEDEKCLADSNGIYTQVSDNNLQISNRSIWLKIEDGKDNETIYSYVYYNKYLRLWIWTYVIDELIDTNDTITFEELTEMEEINITAWCLKWDLNEPSKCNEFYYKNKKNATTIVNDCTISKDNSINYGQEISGWIIVSCVGLGCCVAIIGFYKEYMEKRNKKKKANIRVSILQNDQQIGMTQTQINIAQPDTIVEEKTGDVRAEEEDDENDENDKLNPVISASSTDI